MQVVRKVNSSDFYTASLHSFTLSSRFTPFYKPHRTEPLCTLISHCFLLWFVDTSIVSARKSSFPNVLYPLIVPIWHIPGPTSRFSYGHHLWTGCPHTHKRFISFARKNILWICCTTTILINTFKMMFSMIYP